MLNSGLLSLKVFISYFKILKFKILNFVTLLFIQGIAGFFVTIGIAVVMFKSNDILRKQTALKVFEFFLYGLVLSENLSIFSRIRL
jgi:hypothetical protein